MHILLRGTLNMKNERETNLTRFGIKKLLLQSTLGIVLTIRDLTGILFYLKTRCIPHFTALSYSASMPLFNRLISASAAQEIASIKISVIKIFSGTRKRQTLTYTSCRSSAFINLALSPCIRVLVCCVLHLSHCVLFTIAFSLS